MEGHTDVAAYALDWHQHDPIIASGGRDKQILLWNIDNYFNGHGKIPEEERDNHTSVANEESYNEDMAKE